ncbi:DUF6086 family protein [Kitasatospora saccharophila]|uniref:DUF6086 family protein n=1 Tax=Kitasatospora saccharophila TaxID=407973 RepID=A0ABP5I6M5_9ACTN
MSQYYELNGKTVWNPSMGASGLFLRQVEVFEEVLGLPSGILPMENDETDIDPAAFDAFLHALLTRYRATAHDIIRTLSEGFTATALALALKAGLDVRWAETAPTPVPAWPALAPPHFGSVDELLRHAQDLTRKMPS